MKPQPPKTLALMIWGTQILFWVSMAFGYRTLGYIAFGGLLASIIYGVEWLSCNPRREAMQQ